jgi:hypothetical protein
VYMNMFLAIRKNKYKNGLEYEFSNGVGLTYCGGIPEILRMIFFCQGFSVCI